jgi:hypothetical protein
MKSIILGLAVVLSLLCSVASADESSRRALAKELADLSGVEHLKETMKANAAARLEKLLSRLPDTKEFRDINDKYRTRFEAVYREYLDTITSRETQESAYLDAYGEDELRGIVAFLKTPVGQAWRNGEKLAEREQKQFNDFLSTPVGQAWLLDKSKTQNMVGKIAQKVPEFLQKIMQLAEEMQEEIRRNLPEHSPEEPKTAVDS